MRKIKSLSNLCRSQIYKVLQRKSGLQIHDFLCIYPTNIISLIIQNTEIDNIDQIWGNYDVDEHLNDLIAQRNFNQSCVFHNLENLCLKSLIQTCSYMNVDQLKLFFEKTPVSILLQIRSSFFGTNWFKILQQIIRSKDPNFHLNSF
ncbi:hypothetical protein ACF0H5_013327 [Mactra antiquata]